MNWGGQEYRTLLQSVWMNENGHRSWVGCNPESKIYQVGKEMGVDVIPFDFSKSYRILTTIKCYKFCRDKGVNLINSHGSRDSLICAPLNFLGFPIIRSRHISSRIKRTFLYKHCCKNIITTADIIKKMLVDLGVSASKIFVIGGFVDLTKFSPLNDASKIRDEFQVSPDTVLLTNVGMLRGDKGQMFFLEAADILLKKGYDLKFLLVGEGVKDRKHERLLSSRVRELGIEDRFIMTGYRTDIPDILSASDIVVIASTGVEAQSQVVPQAFASKRAVVATTVGGLPEQIEDNKTGLLVEPGDSQCMADGMERLIKDVDLRRTLAEGGYKLAVRELSFDKMMEKSLEAYKLASSVV